MAARYVDTANIVAQGQSFYTGLLPGSYEKGGAGGGGGNVMGKGSGGSAGVSADRTGSEAAVQSITGYKAGGSILPGGGNSDTDRIVEAIEKQKGDDGGLPTPVQGGDGDTPSGGVKSTDTSGEDFSGLAGLGLYAGGGPRADVFSEGGVRPRNAEEEAKHQEGLAKGKVTRGENKRLKEVGLEAEGDKPGSGMGAWMKSSDAVDAMKQTEASRSSGNAPPLPELPGPKLGGGGAGSAGGVPKQPDYIKKSGMGQWGDYSGTAQRIPSTRSRTRQPGVQQSIPQQAIPSLSVSGAASSRAHTRQPGVQQSATHKAFLFPNMANSTNRTLNF